MARPCASLLNWACAKLSVSAPEMRNISYDGSGKSVCPLLWRLSVTGERNRIAAGLKRIIGIDRTALQVLLR
ncbi:hypothetical protein XFEB_01150 [Xylella fastidiosa EB92.1]|nr:hypothetical protein XFEB_01150 [Xylella fastidiosa EB92.1]